MPLGCGEDAKSSKAPAKVEVLPKETELARITLTEDAHRRLGITTAALTKQSVERHTTIGGDVLIPHGKSIVVAAPVAGTIASPEGGSIPLPGQWVEVGAPVLTLVPLLSPERDVPTPVERVQIANTRATLLSALTVARGDVARSQAEADAARIRLERAEQLFADKAGSMREVDDARALVNVHEATLYAAREREEQLAQLAEELESAGGEGGEGPTPLSLTSPQAGLVRNLSVSRGQTVNAGTTLFEVADTSTMWIRAPVYVGLLQEVDTDVPARIVDLNGQSSFEPREARPVEAPPSADPASSTADLYFETDNADKLLRPGQRVGIELRLRGEEQSLVAPAKSILYDIHGGTWVYAVTGERCFERRRVAVRHTVDDRAVLAEAPPEGTEVVVDGAAELFGTEFGIGK
jgi:RND family efflux transporter MFP subunit